MCNAKAHSRLALLLLLTLLSMGVSSTAGAGLVKGIYLTQTTLEDTEYLNYLIDHAKAVGINTFVVDMEIPSKKYQKNIALLKENNIRYVARVVVFPDGGRADQIASQAYWAKRYRLIETAVNYGANEIQLDYIRYNTRQKASSENAKNILKVVQWYKDKLKPQGIPLQADVFGISSFGESKHIGQNLRFMAQSLDALCPMVYPSHFEPFRVHAVTPYETIYTSLTALRSQFDYKMPVKLYAFIEISNYRYSLAPAKRHAYIIAEMKAVRDSGADGWYVWSAHNKYDYLFSLMGELAKNDPAVLEPGKSGATKVLEAKAGKTTANDDEETEATTTTTTTTTTPAVAAKTPELEVTTPTTAVAEKKLTSEPEEGNNAAGEPVMTNTVLNDDKANTEKVADAGNEGESSVKLSVNDPRKLTWTLRAHHYAN
jgi:hypothetical protein